MHSFYFSTTAPHHFLPTHDIQKSTIFQSACRPFANTSVCVFANASTPLHVPHMPPRLQPCSSTHPNNTSYMWLCLYISPLTSVHPTAYQYPAPSTTPTPYTPPKHFTMSTSPNATGNPNVSTCPCIHIPYPAIYIHHHPQVYLHASTV
jgi:hypothetical protein